MTLARGAYPNGRERLQISWTKAAALGAERGEQTSSATMPWSAAWPGVVVKIRRVRRGRHVIARGWKWGTGDRKPGTQVLDAMCALGSTYQPKAQAPLAPLKRLCKVRPSLTSTVC